MYDDILERQNYFSDKKFKNGDITFIIGIDLSLKFLS